MISKLDKFFRRIYSGHVKFIAQKYGLEEYISDIYWLILKKLCYNERHVEIGGASATFKVETKGEINRFYRDLEENTLLKLIKEMESDDIVYDAGANVGLYTCLLGSLLDNGRVFSFEPMPSNLKKLEQNIKSNRVPATVYDYALSNRSGRVDLTFSEDEAGYTAVVEGGLSNSISVETRTVDELVDKNIIDPPNIIKIDVDGAEYKLIDGLRKTLERGDCRLVYCEIHHGYLDDNELQEIVSILENSGFDVNLGADLWALR